MEPEAKTYNVSFQVHEKEAMLNYFNENGYVVVDNVLSENDCDLSVDEIWMYLEKRGMQLKFFVSQLVFTIEKLCYYLFTFERFCLLPILSSILLLLTIRRLSCRLVVGE
jgi:hypothetical protein